MAKRLLNCAVAIDNATFRYWGNSLIETQIKAIEELSNAVASRPTFFGRRDNEGVLGYILPDERSITIFHTAEEIEKGAEPVAKYPFANESFDILDVHFTARESVLVSIKPRASQTLEGGTVIDVPSVKHLEDALRTKTKLPSEPTERLHFAPTQWCTNKATFTAISDDGKAYTYATDRRTTRAAGRDFDQPIDPLWLDRGQPIEYLSESVVQKVAGGGLYTAALSKDSELFLWGQAAPDAKEELDDPWSMDEDADDYVRLQDLRIDGEPIKATDVAVGAAYILVAVERDERPKFPHQDGGVERAVLAAGNNVKGSLGLGEDVDEKEFVKVYTEVKALRGKKIKQMVCAEWSSFVVVGE
ncbi:hypothetical protein N0V90_005642 [Kalmusia sp. IMI 367209]|nr:hypothetical protein N0V90_005642 [Kalmusia sp. IMI 367209]